MDIKHDLERESNPVEDGRKPFCYMHMLENLRNQRRIHGEYALIGWLVALLALRANRTHRHPALNLS